MASAGQQDTTRAQGLGNRTVTIKCLTGDQWGYIGLVVMKKLTLILACLSWTLAAHSSIIQFDLLGKAGFGLLSGNENGVINGTPGSGGEVGAGIYFDDVSNLLTLNFGWGSANGFTDLSGNATGNHIHGITAGMGIDSFTQNAPVLIAIDSLAGWNSSASAGGFSGGITLTDVQETALLNGQLYVNAHTAMNKGGEIRGNLVKQVPDAASTAILLGAGLCGLATMRRRLAFA